ncbi:HopJ type III effector protein [Cellulophaga sp. E16_2]|uniref:HopJ type III effector protein n=1 Tax=unclassified Cellulophaga TaxID=2634405 RepID=UPI0013FD1463|nr:MULTISPECIES: HopJ type III effector protein [unclassified Cellulophaga]MBO0591085.1 HopJ type III effector protein [Cellulophaga sp. E16_2]
MKIADFKNRLEHTPKEIEFSETMAVIEEHYNFSPTAFTNGVLKNAAGENSGSCKLFAFAVDQELTKEQTLACFGAYYFDDVLNDPAGNGHQNIRNFMVTGFEGLHFDGVAVTDK